MTGAAGERSVSSGARRTAAIAAASLRAILDNPDIRRLQAAWLVGVAADWAFLVAVLVVAYETGGAVAVGLLGLVRMAATTLVALFVVLPRRLPAERTLVAINAIRGLAAAGGAAILAVDGPTEALFAGAVIVAAAGTLVRPIKSALLPSIARTPGELIASNVASSAGEGIGMFVGPVAAGLLFAAVGGAATSAAVAAGFGAAMLLAAMLRVQPVHKSASAEGGSTMLPLVDGARTLRRHAAAALVVVAFASQVLVRGLLTTLIVVASIELLGLGEPGVGLLNGAMGAGGLFGAVGAIALAGRRRLAPAFALALACWGLPIAVIGAWPLATLAVFALGVVGASNALLDISGYTLLQRSIPHERRTGVFLVLEGAIGVAGALGAVAAPFLVEAIGVRPALAVSGALLPLVALAAWPRLSRLDREMLVPERELAILRSIPMFALVPLTALERLAGSLASRHLEVGETLIREGEPGDDYYIVADGCLDVSQAGRHIRSCRRGEGVGEIALLREIPRTATVAAAEPTEVFALDGAEFRAAVATYPGSTTAADRIIGDRLATTPR